MAARALRQMGAAAATPEVVTALLQALAESDSNVLRQAAAWVLGQLGAAAATPGVVTALLQALADPDAHVRWAAAATLGRLGAGRRRQRS